MLKQILKKKQAQIIGIDIGSRAVKAVLLQETENGHEVAACACEYLPANVLVDRDVRDAEALSNTLRKVKLALKTKQDDIATAVSGSSVITKVVYMDKGMNDLELETQIELEADSLIPYPLDQVYLDFEELGDSKAAEEKVDVLLTAAHRDLIDTRVTVLQEVQFVPKVIDVETYALANALLHFAPVTDAEDEQPQPVVCANIGNNMMTLAAVQGDDVIYCKEHMFGSDVILQDLAIMNSLDKLEAERQLIQNELPATWRQDSLPQFVANLAQQLSRAIQMYASATGKGTPSSIMIAGGVACIEAINEELSREMNIQVEIFNPFAHLTISEQAAKQGAERLAPQMAIAAGLASRGFAPWHI